MGRKQLYGYFKKQTVELGRETIWTWQRTRNVKKETESLLMAA